MDVRVDHITPLHIAAFAIRQCWQSQGKSDTETEYVCDKCGSMDIEYNIGDDNMNECRDCFTSKVSLQTVCGPNDLALIDRIGNKFKHASTLEHITINFTINGVSRALLQELARHRMASPSVKSTRYTLKELKDEEPFTRFIPDGIESVEGAIERAKKYVIEVDGAIDIGVLFALDRIRIKLAQGVANDKAKYCLPESYKTDLAWTINARSLQNFLSLRSSKAALWEIRQLAQALFDALPEQYKYLFEDHINKETNESN